MSPQLPPRRTPIRPETAGRRITRSGRLRLTIQRGRGCSTAGVGVDDVVTGSGSGHETAVVAPVEPEPCAEAAGDLILEVRGLVKLFIVIDAVWKAGLADGRTGSSILRRKESSRNRGHDDERRKVVEVGNVRTKDESRNLGIVPVDGEEDRRVAQNAEVEGIMCVLPDVVAANHEVLAERLLQARVKLVAESWLESARDAGRAGEKRREYVVQTSLAR